MAHLTCDVAIIGAGTAGLSAERTARSHGARTLLIDETFFGTTCTNVGCMPSKLLIAAGASAHAARRSSIFGIDARPTVDGHAVMERLRKERDRFIASVDASIAKIPDEVKRKGRARFTGPTTLALDDGTTISAGAIVIATGSRPSVPSFLQGSGAAVLTNETLFDLPDLPKSVGVVGAGPLGLELAQALSRLGVAVHVFDEGTRLAALEDNEIARCLLGILAEEFPIDLGVKLSAGRDGEGIRLAWSGQSQGEARFDYVLAAAGRPPVLSGLGLETTGLDLDEHGAPHVDAATLQCADAPIFLAGDADHSRPVLHEAQAEGTIAGRNAAAFPEVRPGKRMVPLSITFTDPPLATVGEKAGADTLIGPASYDDQGRAKVFAVNQGLAHLYADRQGVLTGAVLATPAAEHLGHFLACAIDQGMTASEVLGLPIYHPTYEEGLKPALRALCKASGTRVPMERDDGFLAGA